MNPRSTLAAAGFLLLSACSGARHPDPQTVPVLQTGDASAPPFPPPVRPVELPRTHVLMLSGGGSAAINYQSHLLHLQNLRDLLLRAGIAATDISILTSDGSDPAPDLATRAPQPEPDFWRVTGTRLERPLETPTTLIDSKIEGVTLSPATKTSVSQWFDGAADRLHPGDTLVLYVTDHGTRKTDDPQDNQIMLWGKDASISVRELEGMVAKLDPAVRVVSLMSQCYSGAFAGLAMARMRDGEPAGNVCGYFSSTADRRAYGCYAENRGKANVGHSFEFMRALARTGRFTAAHDEVLAVDATPDVPLRTSDTYLESLVRKSAMASGVTLNVRADALLRQAFADPGAWQAETAQLDRIAQAGGSFSPRSLGELDELAQKLPENDNHLTRVSGAWREALGDANTSNLDAFVAAHPEWAARLADTEVSKLGPDDARRLTGTLLAELGRFTENDAPLERRLEALQTRGAAAEAASYRMQVRLAMVLRLRTLLLSIAGRQYLLHDGKPQEKAAFDALRTCEDLSFPSLGHAPPAATEPAEAPPAYPPFEAELKATETTLPGWMGITFKDPGDDVRAKKHLSRGASLVSLVFPDSPALAAGFEVGDIVLGPPSAPFTSRNQIRAWTMLSEVGKPGTLVVLRDGRTKQLTITPKPFPMKWPALPGPMQVGSEAPKIDLHGYRGPVAAAVRKGSKHVLYFWATWCGPCKAAVPELVAFEKARKVPVIAVTDEPPPVLDAFFKKFSAPFPNAVGVDELRRAFVAYGVSGTPTFVLIDEKGKIAGYQVGYDRSRGLPFEGWTWPERNAPVAPLGHP